MAEKAELHDGVFMVRNLPDEEIDRDFIEKLFKRYCKYVMRHSIDESKAYYVVPKANREEIKAILENLVGKTFKNHEIWCCKEFYEQNYRLGRPTRW
ncbi:unnamed protein product [Didymodactylos carnosus]|uniref:Uncharacterized protein n=1 Tax=Didymodactylos carnosus TaxID=1234261 RepID=A0A815JQJ3_9BILA|nr:unnamed protein product [Didymodactylos carnosus]CAF1382952.1 unnamed protein product [Didymodactylos carnosus]CAF3728697.1 unnamed protein product [Didymodactylos carnosus]CAF4278150.1 unnamed protein product [Didymodactylos carnosus]